MRNQSVTPNRRNLFVGNWLGGNGSLTRARRRRLMAILRMAHRVLGIRRKRLGLGALEMGGSIALSVAPADVVAHARPTRQAVLMRRLFMASAVLLSGVSTPVLASTCLQGGTAADGSVANQSGTVTCSTFSIAIGGGSGAQASNYSIAIGDDARASGTSATGLGRVVRAQGNQSTAIGSYSSSAGGNSTALGYGANSSATDSTALGAGAAATADSATAVGMSAQAANTDATSLGHGANADGLESTAVGSAARSGGTGSVAVGASAVASNDGSIAVGEAASANNNHAIALGSSASASGVGSQAYGETATASGGNSIALGNGSAAAGDSATAVGAGASAEDVSATALGINASASGGSATALGDSSIAVGENALAVGARSEADGQDSVAIGSSALGNGEFAVAIGTQSQATGYQSQAYGVAATASGSGSVALGTFATVTGDSAMALGPASTANADGAIAIGVASDAEGINSVAVDGTAYNHSSTALGDNAVAGVAGSSTVVNDTAVGKNAQAIGGSSSAFGDGASASGSNSVALGVSSAAQGDKSVAIGDGAVAATSRGIYIGSEAGVVDPGVDISANLGDNIGIGALAGQNVNGVKNDALGISSGQNVNGDANAVFGSEAGSTVTGTGNAAMGPDSGNRVVGDANLSAGQHSGNDVQGNNNVALGAANAGSNVEGSNNTALGQASGYNVVGNENIALGDNAGAVMQGSNNTSLGQSAGLHVVGNGNAALGDNAGANVQGSNNTALGQLAGYNVIGNNNSATGYGAGDFMAGDANAVTGNYAGMFINGNNNVAMGSGAGAGYFFDATGTLVDRNGDSVDLSAGFPVAALNDTIALGDLATTGADRAIALGTNSYAAAIDSIALGSSATANDASDVAIGANSSAAGESALAFGNGATAATSRGIYIGVDAGTGGAGLGDNLGIGTFAGQNVDGDQNSAFGASTGQNISGRLNTAIGADAGSAVTGSSNTALGTNAGNTVVGDLNFSAGQGSGNGVQGSNNTALGQAAGYGVVGDDNVALGDNAGVNVQGGSNTALGLLAGYAAVGNRNSATGYGAGYQMAGDANAATGNDAGMFIQGDNNVAMGTGAGAGYLFDTTGNLFDRNGNLVDVSGGFPVVALNDTIAVGNLAATGGDRAIALGANSYAAATDSLAIGSGAQATGANTISIGAGNVVSGDGSGAFGDPSTVSGAGSYAFGNNNTIAQDDSFVLGNDVTTTQGNSVVLGNASADRAATTETGVTLGGTAYTYAGQGSAANGVVSVGAEGAERQVINVAAGRVAEDSTDAVNGSELFATNSKVAQNTTDITGLGNTIDSINAGGGIRYFHANSTLADSQANGADSTAVGPNAIADGASSVAEGNGAHAISDGTVAIGQGAVAGDATDLTRVNEVAIGNGAVSSAQNSVAIGDLALANGAQGTALGSGAVAGTNATATGRNATAGNSSVAYGLNAKAAATRASALGQGAVASATDSTAVGSFASASATSGVAIGRNATVTAANSVALGTASTAARGAQAGYTGFALATPQNSAGEVSVGGAGAERQITNVAAGSAATDAVNVSQLTAVNDKADALGDGAADALGGGASYDPTTGTLTGPAYHVQGGAQTDVGGALDALDTQVTTNTTDIANLGGTTTTNTTDIAALQQDALQWSDGLGAYDASHGSGTAQKIANVAAGDLSDTSTDAVNGSQLKATNDQIASVATTAANAVQYDDAGHTSVTLGGVGAIAPVGLHNVAAGTADTDAVNVGQLTAVDQKADSVGGAVASTLGGGASYDPATGIVTGPTYHVQGGTQANVGDALGALDTQVTTNTSDIANLTTNVANGAAGPVQRTGTAGQLALIAPGGAGTAPGAAQRLTNLADGDLSDTSTDAVNGSQLKATNDQVTQNSSDIADNTTAITNLGGTTTTNTTDIAALQQDALQWNDGLGAYDASHGTGAAQKITNIAAGDLSDTSTDAVNGSQLKATNDQVAQNSSDIADNTTAITNLGGATTTNTTDIATLQQDALQWNDGLGAYDASHGSGTAQKITNVAAGDLSDTSTDAVNGSQLKATNDQVVQNSSDIVNLGNTVDAINNGIGIKYFHANSTLADALASGADSVAAGPAAVASGAESTAIGNGAAAGIDGSIALGAGSVADRAIAPATGTILAGTSPIPFNTADATLLGAVSVGNAASGSYRQIINVADGTSEHDAVTIRQLTGALQSFATTTTEYFHANSTGGDALAIGADSVAVGPTTVVNGDNGIGIGNGATVAMTAPGGTAIGDGAGVSQSDAVAIGTQSQADGIESVAIGAGANASFASSVAIGAGAATTVGARDGYTGYGLADTQDSAGEVSVGAAGAERQVTNVAAGSAPTDAVNVSQLDQVAQNAADSLGGGAAYDPVSGAYTGPSYHVGGTTYSSAGDALAAQDQIVGNQGAGIAAYLGGGASYDPATGTIGGGFTVDGTTYADVAAAVSGAAAAAGNAVQYDDAGHTGVTLGGAGAGVPVGLHNVAAGDVSAGSTDAVNGSQLAATNDRVAQNASDIADNTDAISNLGDQVDRNSSDIASLGDKVDQNSSDIDTLAQGIENGSVGLVRQTGGAPGNGQITIGSSTGGTSVSVAGTDGDRVISGVADGVAADDAVNVSQLAAAITSASQNAVGYDDDSHTSVTFNKGGDATGLHNVAAGAVAAGSTDAVNGSQLYETNQQVASNTTQIDALNNGEAGAFRSNNTSGLAAPSATGDDAVAGGFGAVASGSHATALGANASATGDNSVALGYGSNDGGRSNVVSVGAAGAERQVTNVAAGTEDTDAVNLGQLDSGLADTLHQANAYTDSRLNALDYDINQARRDADAGTASALAAAALPQAFTPGKGMIAGGIGVWRGETAVALGLSKAFNDGHTVVKGGATFTNRSSTFGANMGVGYQF
jgi:autotransporter adhesin